MGIGNIGRTPFGRRIVSSYAGDGSWDPTFYDLLTSQKGSVKLGVAGWEEQDH